MSKNLVSDYKKRIKEQEIQIKELENRIDEIIQEK
jgi:hypothetical protein